MVKKILACLFFQKRIKEHILFGESFYFWDLKRWKLPYGHVLHLSEIFCLFGWIIVKEENRMKSEKNLCYSW